MQNNDIRGTAATLIAAINNMCNAKETEIVANMFIECKDLLIALYQQNIERCK